MKYIITGSLGHISKPLTEKLIKAGHNVTVITSKEEKRKAIEAIGAKAAVGSVEDLSFLKNTFAGADAVYTMVPPNMSAANWKEWIGQIGKNYTTAIKENNIRYVVNLSSIGADLPDGCGPVSGIYKVEQSMNSLTDVNIKHLRAASFTTNILENIGMIKHMNIIGNNYGGPGFKIALVDPKDIADAAFEELTSLNFAGHSIRYVASDERTTDDIAKVIGEAIGKPDLPWVVFTDEQALGGIMGAGLPEEIAKNYVELGAALQSGKMLEDYWKNRPATLGKIKLEDFAKSFAEVYNAG